MSQRALCQYQEQCSGCSLLHLDMSFQKMQKINHLKDLSVRFQLEIPDIGFQSVGTFSSRDRLDFAYSNGRLGLYHKNNSSKEIIDIEVCPQLSPELQILLSEFRVVLHKHSIPLKKANFRLRKGYGNLKGLWIDAANIEIKELLDERCFLSELLSLGYFIEIGQKGKRLQIENNLLKLKDPQPEKWFSSTYKGQEVPIYSLISSFTQPSMNSNKIIASLIHQWSRKVQARSVVEFGAGIGNLSLAGKDDFQTWIACEYDSQALECFEKSWSEISPDSKEFVFLNGDFQNKKTIQQSVELALVNPPRSGLKRFTENLKELKPKAIIYMSCYSESMMLDIEKLKPLYKIQELCIVDQFPQTPHYEAFALLQLHQL